MRATHVIAVAGLIAQHDDRVVSGDVAVFESQGGDHGDDLMHEGADLVARDACHADRG